MNTSSALFRPLSPGVVAFTEAGLNAETFVRERISTAGRIGSTLVLRAPPVIPTRVVEHAGYLMTFPHLLGVVRSFDGDRSAHRDLIRAQGSGDDWTAKLATTGMVLTPAACHSLYHLLADTTVDELHVEISATCYRNEASAEPGRLRSFSQLEYVYVGTADDTNAFAEDWNRRALTIVRSLGLRARLAPAQDPFFGAATTLIPQDDVGGGTPKSEILVEVDGTDLAVASVNRHGEHFGRHFDIATSTGPASTACVGFGIERLLIAAEAAHLPWLANANHRP